MTKEKKDWQESLKLAKEALEKIDKEKYPKRHKIQEELVDTLQYNENMRIRAEKAEEEAKKAKEATPPKTEGEETPKKPAEEETPKNLPYSLKDIRALNKVHDEDVERVEKFAKSEDISIPEALENDDLKAILRDREEKRATADASNTGKGRRGTSKVSGKELLRKFKVSEGELPESDEEIEALAEARLKAKMESE